MDKQNIGWNIALVIGAVGSFLVFDDGVFAASVVTLWIIWRFLQPSEGPPVLALALTFQWIQVTCGLFYTWWTGHMLEANTAPALDRTIIYSLTGIVVTVAGLRVGQYLINRNGPPSGLRPDNAFDAKLLWTCYATSIFIVATIQEVAWDYPSLTQAALALTNLKLAMLYLLMRRLVHPEIRWVPFFALLTFEVGLGFTGFFAGFREPLMMAMIAILEAFRPREVRHWAAATVLVVAAVGTGVFWIGVRKGYREAIWENDAGAKIAVGEFDRLAMLRSGWAGREPDQLGADMDRLVDRMWTVYYPALAIERTPSVMPHADGRLMRDALTHLVTPRVFFPNKPSIILDSELVRKYSGVWVAGERENTNIAFGYLAESYVDFGVPLMFVPMFLFGIYLGLVYAGFLRFIAFRDFAVGATTVICWLSLYLFERSWAKTIGLSLTMTIYIGMVIILLDRFWLEYERKRREIVEATLAHLHPQHSSR